MRCDPAQVRDPLWEERRLLDGPRGLGRAGDERAARILPAHPPGMTYNVAVAYVKRSMSMVQGTHAMQQNCN